MGRFMYFYAYSYGCGCSDMLASNLSQVVTNPSIIDHDYVTHTFGYVIAVQPLVMMTSLLCILFGLDTPGFREGSVPMGSYRWALCF